MNVLIVENEKPAIVGLGRLLKKLTLIVILLE
jgi:hypothetical protein